MSHLQGDSGTKEFWLLRYETCKFKTLWQIPVISANICSSFRKFLEFTGIIYRNCYCEQRNVYWHPSMPQRCSQTKRPKKGGTKSWFLLHNNALAHWSVLIKDFLAKNVTTLEHPHTLLTWLQLIFTCSLYWNHHWSDSAYVMLLKLLRMWQKSWRGLHKMASRNVSNTFTVAGSCS